MSQTNDETTRNRASGERISLGGDRDIYDDRGLPIIKSTWFWVLAGLLILGSGIIIGLALSRFLAPAPVIKTTQQPLGREHAEVAAIDVRRNRYARRVAELERILGQNVCLIDEAELSIPGGVGGAVREPERPSGTDAAPADRAGGSGVAPVPGPAGPAGPSAPALSKERSEAGASGQSPAKAAPDSQSPPADAASKAAQATPPPQATPSPEPAKGPPQPPATPASASPPSTTRFGDVLGAATVLVMSKQGNGVSIGSGFLISPTDVVTNAHVVAEGPREVSILNESLGSTRRATVLATSWQKGVLGGADFALLRLAEPVTGIRPLELSLKAQKAQEVIASGFPGTDLDRQVSNGAKPDSTFTRGSIRIIEQYQGRFPVINHDADIRKGNSGGPLVDKCGRVLGVNTYALENLDFALSTQGLLEFLKQYPGTRYQLSNEDCVS